MITTVALRASVQQPWWYAAMSVRSADDLESSYGAELRRPPFDVGGFRVLRTALAGRCPPVHVTDQVCRSPVSTRPLSHRGDHETSPLGGMSLPAVLDNTHSQVSRPYAVRTLHMHGAPSMVDIQKKLRCICSVQTEKGEKARNGYWQALLVKAFRPRRV